MVALLASVATLVPGQSIRLLGEWKDHERYGETFQAIAYEHAAPRSVAGLVAFLASDRFPGVGRPAVAGQGAEGGVDLRADAVEVPVDARGVEPPQDHAGGFPIGVGQQGIGDQRQTHHRGSRRDGGDDYIADSIGPGSPHDVQAANRHRHHGRLLHGGNWA